ncbi:BlaI/MecI/CopY family transcriptional regulator [Streptomyces sp. NPDC002144]
MAKPEQRRPRRAQGALDSQMLAVLRTADARVTAAWVRERLGDDLAYTTVMTVLSRLLGKQSVSRRRQGRSFAWEAAGDEAGLAALRMRKVLDRERDRHAVPGRFVTALPADDERVLRDLLGRTADERTG